MKKKTIICRTFAALLCVTLVLGTAQFQIPAAQVFALTSDSIKEKEAQIEQAKRDKENLQNGLTDLQKLKRQLETKRSDLKSYVAELDSNLAVIEQNIANLKQQIEQKENEIVQTQDELDTALEKENSQMESMVSYIRFVYEIGDPKVIDILLASTSFTDFLNKADYVEKVISYEHVMWQDYKMIREYTELCMEQLELEKEILDQAKANADVEQQNLEELIDQKTQDILSYETDINNKAKAIREMEEELVAQEEEIAALEAAILEEKKRLLASNGSVLHYDNGEFKFPLAAYTRVSDEYGMRIHPTLGVEQFHNGVDFASPKGTDIYAA